MCGKTMPNCGKVLILMCSGLVILASSLSPLRKNVKHPISSPVRISKKTYTDLINT